MKSEAKSVKHFGPANSEMKDAAYRTLHGEMAASLAEDGFAPDTRGRPWFMAGRSLEVRRLVQLCERAAKGPHAVLLEGEPGSGHELTARYIHRIGRHANKPFRILVNGANFTQIIESIQISEPGTYYINDITNLDEASQYALLNLLKELRRDDAAHEMSVIAACTGSLMDAVRDGHFVHDLYLMLSISPVRLPALRHRLDDIPALAEAYFRQRRVKAYGERPKLAVDAITVMSAHKWLRNITELEDCLRDLLEKGVSRITAVHLPALFSALLLSDAKPRHSAKTSVPETLPSIEVYNAMGEIKPLANIEAELIRIALTHYRGSIADTARHLRLARSTLYRKIRKCQIAIPTQL